MKKLPLLLLLALTSVSPVFGNPYPAPAQESELPVALEPWVKSVTVDSSRVTEDNCTHIERGAIVNLVNDKLAWMPKLNGYRGILVIHPFSPKRPALIEFPVTPADAGKFIKVAARGSDHEPGGTLRFLDGETPLGELDIDSEWVESGVKIPPGAKVITLAWYPKQWFNEQLWVDSVSVVASLPKASE
jgi:hypothetical protein